MTTPVNDTFRTALERLIVDDECRRDRDRPEYQENLREAREALNRAATASEDEIARAMCCPHGCIRPEDCWCWSSTWSNQKRESAKAIQALMQRSSPANDELERLRERCEGYRGQVEAGSIAIQHLQGEIDRLRAALNSILNLQDRMLSPETLLGRALDIARRETAPIRFITSGQPQEPRG